MTNEPEDTSLAIDTIKIWRECEKAAFSEGMTPNMGIYESLMKLLTLTADTEKRQ